MRIIRYLPLLILINCSHDDVQVDPSEYPLLTEVKADGKAVNTFEYDGGQLIREFTYSTFCTNNSPVQQFSYTYQGNKVVKINSTDNMFFSSIGSMCDSSLGLKSEQVLEYDADGKIIKITNAASYTIFEYNAQNQVVKQTIYLPDGTARYISSFMYDSRGNLSDEIDAQGNLTSYIYDNKKNPYYYMKQRPNWISVYNKSPNNVVKATGSFIMFNKQYKYNALGFPTEVAETNGATYYYIYQ